MVGAKPAVSRDQIVQALDNFEIFELSGELKKKNDVVWRLICDQWNNLMKPINLFHYIRQDRQNVLSHYKRSKGLVQDECTSDSFSDCSDSDNFIANDIYEPNYKPAVSKKFKQDQLNFAISYTETEWAALKPVKKLGKSGRSYFALQKGWPDVFVKSIWQLQKLPCVYIFKRASVRIDCTSSFLSIHGQCKDCGAVLHGECARKPKDDENIIINIKTVNTRGIPHTGIRRLAGPEQDRVKGLLRHKKPQAVRRNIANEEMNYDAVEPAYLYFSPVLRKAQQEVKDEDLGIQNSVSLWESLDL